MKKNEKDLLLKSSYYYDLPEELIAQTPVEPRDSSRLLVFNKEKDDIEHKTFSDIIDYLNPGDILVVNNTRVLPARLFGYKDTGAKIEILLQKRINLTDWEVIAKHAKRLSEDIIVTFSENLSCKVLEKGEYGSCKIKFIFNGVFEQRLNEVGQVPGHPNRATATWHI